MFVNMFDTKKNRNVDKSKHLLVFFMKNFDINTRIKELIDFLKLKNNEFAREIGISSSRMSNISTNRNKPDAEMLQLILRKYTNVSARWLLIGSGEMLIREQPSGDDPQNNNLYRLLKNKDNTIISLATEVGSLREQVRVLKKQTGYSHPDIAAES